MMLRHQLFRSAVDHESKLAVDQPSGPPGPGILDSIPMPPDPSPASDEGCTPSSSSKHSAWAKAQQALAQVGGRTTAPVAKNQSPWMPDAPNDVASAMMQFYPWMQQYSVGMPSQNLFSPTPPSSGNANQWQPTRAPGPMFAGSGGGGYNNNAPAFQQQKQQQQKHQQQKQQQQHYQQNTTNSADYDYDYQSAYPLQQNNTRQGSNAEAYPQDRSTQQDYDSTNAYNNNNNKNNNNNSNINNNASIVGRSRQQQLYTAHRADPNADDSPPPQPPATGPAFGFRASSTQFRPQFQSRFQQQQQRHHQQQQRMGGPPPDFTNSRRPPFGTGGQRQQRKATGGNTEPLGGGGSSPPPPFGAGPPPVVDLPSPPSKTAAGRADFGSGDTLPGGVSDYVERAYMAVDTDEDKNKVEQYLKKKLGPLLQSGAAWTVDWSKEKLPHEENFEIKQFWTPASQLRKQQQAAVRGGGMRSGVLGGGGGDRGSSRFGGRGRGRGAAVPAGRGGGAAVRKRWDSGSSRGSNAKSNNQRSPARGRFDRRRSRSRSSRSSGSSSSRSRGTTWRKRAAADGQNNQRNQRYRPGLSDSDIEDVTPASKRGKNKKKKKNANENAVKKPWTVAGVGIRQQQLRKEERARRFAKDNAVRKRPPPKVAMSRINRLANYEDDDLFTLSTSPKRQGEDVDFSRYDVVGTCQDIEKSFFRLTTAPDPTQVRPPQILHVSLEVAKKRYLEKSDYRYASDQLKSIRQDLTIQCHRSDFTVIVYETHARIALENGDREEFNQCQSQLKLLYKEIPGCPNEHEFTAYRLLYYVYMANTLDITTLLYDLSAAAKRDVCIKYALNVRQAWALHSYHRLFRLYKCAPRMSSYVMDLCLERERKAALKTMLKAYRPTLQLSFIAGELNFDENELRQWLAGLSIAPMKEDTGKVDCRVHANTAIS